MIVTDKKYHLENRLIKKLDLICDRCSGVHDALLLCDGDEGFGKTTLSGDVGYYIAYKLKRPFSVANFFFNLDDMVKFAVETKEQVIIWDEAALGGLASEWNTASQKKLMKMLMIARKKRHFYIFNIPKFFKLNEYLVVDRAIGLMHVYSRDGKSMGRFCYYKNNALENLFYEWRRKRKRAYKKLWTFTGTFPNALGKIIDLRIYEHHKDGAIMRLAEEKGLTKDKLDLLALKYKLATNIELSREKMAKMLGISARTIQRWLQLPSIHPQILANGAQTADTAAIILK